MLANVDRLSPEQSAALGDFVEAGGGMLVAPGDRTDASSFNDAGWMPARLGDWKGNAAEAEGDRPPVPRGHSRGPLMAAFGQGDAPALAEADFFAFAVLAPSPGSAVLGRLDTGDPWLVERSQGRGRILVLATPIDAEARDLAGQSRLRPADPRVGLPPGRRRRSAGRAGRRAADLPARSRAPRRVSTALPVETPGGEKAKAEVIRGGGLVRARIDDTTESGIYRLILPDPPGGFMYGAVARDDRESDMTPLDPAEAAKLAEGWPLQYVTEAKEGGAGALRRGGWQPARGLAVPCSCGTRGVVPGDLFDEAAGAGAVGGGGAVTGSAGEDRSFIQTQRASEGRIPRKVPRHRVTIGDRVASRMRGEQFLARRVGMRRVASLARRVGMRRVASLARRVGMRRVASLARRVGMRRVASLAHRVGMRRVASLVGWYEESGLAHR